MLDVTEKLILTSGPSITNKEVEYVLDAVQNGWNLHHSDYIKKLEDTFAEYIGVKYAMATSSCTGALHLALLALGIGPGDEVIVPETTWIATASTVVYVGATPVFADIEPDTWVMDLSSVEKLITQKTKVIVPVHLYGQPVNMDPLLDLASKYGITILEDAAPSIGAEYKGKKTGSFGRIAAFSFQGAKALVSGEGGILVSDDEKLMERARFLGDHGRDPDIALRNIEIGYKYKMSNIQAALGLAQVERAEEIVERKQQIYEWYRERLQDIDTIRLNVRKPWARNLFWMTSLVLDDTIKFSRDELMNRLKERNIDTRPLFYPISSFPMFKGVETNNPVAYSVPLRGINLPSGHDRTEEEIDYICYHIRDILGYKSNKVGKLQPHGWLVYRDKVNQIIRTFKNAQPDEINSFCLPLMAENKFLGRLRPLTNRSLKNQNEVQILADWREAAQNWFPSQFKVTLDGTRRWLEKQVLQTDDRILFMVEDDRGTPIGHVGLFRFDYKQKFCELDNIIRGNTEEFPGAMTHACKELIKWAFNELGAEKIYLRVASDNKLALKLYEKLNFVEIQRTPLLKVYEKDIVRWIEVVGEPYYEVERYSVTMKLLKNEWMKNNGITNEG